MRLPIPFRKLLRTLIQRTIFPVTVVVVALLSQDSQSIAKQSTKLDAVEKITLDPVALETASSLFATKCAVCHGSDGKGSDPTTNLADNFWKHGDKLSDIERVIREGIPNTPMKGHQDQFKPTEVAQLAKYVKHLAGTMHAKTESGNREDATELTDSVSRQLPSALKSEVNESANFVDDYIFGKMKADKIPHAGLSTDSEFLRRIYLDLWGRLPDSEIVRAFVADRNPKKREELIDRLLGLDFLKKPGNDDYKGPWLVEEPFLAKWTYFFGDLFRNGPQGNQKQFRDYIYQFLKFNLPYNYVVKDMLTATAIHNSVSGSAGFLLRHQVDGLRCADVMHEDTLDEIAVHSTKLFLGVNTECISCHDGAGHLEKINLWLSKRERVEFWRQAAFFGNIRIIRPGLVNQEFTLLDGAALRPENIWQGKIANFQFASKPNELGGLGYRMEAPSVLRIARDPKVNVYPEFILTKEQPAKGVNPREEYARMITTSFQFAKVTANLFWAKLMSVGIVDPPFDWDLDRQDPKSPPAAPWTLQPSHPELLDALAKDFIKNNYDLRLLMRTICRSKAYQLSSRFEGEYKPEYDRYYARKLARRLSAEEIYDAIAKATNIFSKDVKYAMEQTGPPADGELKRFLDFFGQSNRITKQATSKSSVIQASLMMNSGLVKNKVSASTEGSRVNQLLAKSPPPSNDQVVEELFLSTLSRFPTKEEAASSVKHIEKYRDKGAEDLQWALINKLEFVVNY